MPRRKIAFAPGSYYHVFNRVVVGEKLFTDHNSYVLFLKLTKGYAAKYKVNVICYCLMPNHYHFLLKQISDTQISKFISVLLNSYVQKVNKFRDRKGPLFSGRFKDVLVDRDEYLIHLCRYIHLNPVEAGLVEHLEEWPYSNYLEWTGERKGELVDPEFTGRYFKSQEEYRNFVLDSEDLRQSEISIRPYLLD
jgi:REP element-mobilizing transposase RayT